ncbi:efflux RND transporter permease subunit [bacterium]|nr:MAG: efflux RND transporter permease subunit [bacterium]
MSGHFRGVGRIVRYFVDSKLTALLVLAATLFGIFAVLATPREENPQITAPAAVVTVSDPGIGRAQIEQNVTKPIERVLQEIPGVEHLYSTSSEGLATVIVRYYVGEDKTRSYVDLYNQLMANRAVLPPGAQDPAVTPLDVDDVPIVVLTLSGSRYDDVTLRALAHRLADAVQPVPGASVISMSGGREQAVDVALDPAKLAGYEISPQDIERALGVTNVEQATGYVAGGGHRLLLHAGTPLSTPAQVASQIVAVRAGVPIALGDVAGIKLAAPPLEHITTFADRANPQPATAISVAVAKKRGSNAVTVARGVLAAARGVELPPGIALSVTRDDGAKANAAVNELIRRLLEAIVIVTLLLLVALGRREAVIVAIAIPLTLFITLGIALLAHQTINRITLFALILALGLLVDDAIVVVENIHRHLRGGSTDVKATIAAAVEEIASPTILATIAVIFAFVPMAFVTGMMGPYMRPIPFNVPVAMVVSLVVAIVVTPWAAQRMLGTGAHGAHHGRRPQRWEPLYRRALTALLTRPRARGIFFVALAAALGVALLLPLGKAVQFRMLPDQNESTFLVTLDEPAGTDLPTTTRAAQALTARLMADPNVANVETFVGHHSIPDFNGLLQGVIFRDAPWYADLRVNLVPKDRRKIASADLVRQLRGPLQSIGAGFGGLVKMVQEPPGPPVRATVMARVFGPDPEIRAQIARGLLPLFRREGGVVDVDSTLRAQPVRVQVSVDARKAALAGVSAAQVAEDLAIAYGGAVVSTLHDTRTPEPVSIYLRFAPFARADLGTLGAIAIPTAHGNVPLSALTTLSMVSAQQPSYREDGRGVDYVTAEMAGRSSTYAVIDMLLARLHHPLPAGYSISWDGEWKLTLDVFRDLGRAMGVAVVLIYLLLVARFRSFYIPVVVMAAIPLGIIGVMPGFALLAPHGVYFSATAMIGVIALSGIVVRNSIVLVEFIEDELRGGIGLHEAVIRAGTVRARPILLTAAAGVFSSAVIAADPVWSGLAWALVFGMTASALLSIIVVPLLYALVAKTDPLVPGAQPVHARSVEPVTATSAS